MNPVDTPLEYLTFVFAWLGYLSVTVAMLAQYASSERTSKWAAPTMAGVATFHVLLVWGVRHNFDPSHLAVSGAALVPIVLLYTLFALILVHAFGRSRSSLAARAVYPAWVLVTLMGVPGPFMMPTLAWLKVPLTGTFILGVAGLVLLRRRARADAVAVALHA